MAHYAMIPVMSRRSGAFAVLLVVKDLRLTAKRPNGEPVELIKDFRSGLATVFGGKR